MHAARQMSWLVGWKEVRKGLIRSKQTSRQAQISMQHDRWAGWFMKTEGTFFRSNRKRGACMLVHLMRRMKQFLRFILMQKSAESLPKEQGRKLIDSRCWWSVSCAWFRGKCEVFLWCIKLKDRSTQQKIDCNVRAGTQLGNMSIYRGPLPLILMHLAKSRSRVSR